VPDPSLILGGTPEAAALAQRAVAAGLDVVTSLAGATRAPAPQAGRLRVGGFGGAAGLAAWLDAERVARVVDATHPFAARMHANAAAACVAAGVPLLRLTRPPWVREPGDRWTDAADAAEAARLVPAGEGVVFLAVGRKELPAFAEVDARFLVRLIEPAPTPLRRAELILARGPFAVADELALFREKGVRLVVAKNSGGAGAYAKLAAARALGLPAILIARPALAPAAETASLDEALAFLAG
jgi:precorrin-6A/cobalt-precorrin-6A reductase